MLGKALSTAAAGNAAGEATYVEDVFSTYLYTGNFSTQDIVNGIDLTDKGGLVWIKNRSYTYQHHLVDTERGPTKKLATNSTSNEITESYNVDSFNADGFSINFRDEVNSNGRTYASWTFAKQEKFFDVVTYTGNGTAGRTVSHNLNSVPGMIVVKRTDASTNWFVWHRSFASNDNYLMLNNTQGVATNSSFFGGAPTSTTFTVGSNPNINASGGSYVAYVFAHNNGDGIFGENGDQDIIKCGSYYGSNQTIDLGFEPQFIIVKNTSLAENWMMFDNMRGWNADGNHLGWLIPNASNAESTLTNGQFELRSDGFFTGSGYSPLNGNSTYMYIAIRRGPMKTPTSGTEVFDTVLMESDGSLPTVKSSLPVVDFEFYRRPATTENWYTSSRLMQGKYLQLSTTIAEVTNATTAFDYMYGYGDWTTNLSAYRSWNFRRAPGFFDVVGYKGDGTSNRTIPHNLGVTPELWIQKIRSTTGNWSVVANPDNDTYYDFGYLNTVQWFGDALTWTDPPLTSTDIHIQNSGSLWNSTNQNYIAYLFATLPGVSKVGSYTGNGTSQTIDCGFSTGARLVIIKRTDANGDWWIFDTERGIVAGNDAANRLNLTNADNTGFDSIDPNSSGFDVVYNAYSEVNVSSASYIFLAIA